MAETENILRRIDAALGALAERAAEAAPVAPDEASAELERLKSTNTRLETELTELKAQRDRDVRDIDTLVAELKPLIGEA